LAEGFTDVALVKKISSCEGRQLITEHCGSCHGRWAESADNWVNTDDQGRYPAPQLNGATHAWHHRYPELVKTIREGTLVYMPAWKTVLNDAQISASITYI
jgi:mono/diheme cytochrome c family protein